MSVFTFCLIALVAYLLGSIPFGYLLVRIFRSEDIRKTGSGNIGATNVIRSGAKGLGALTFLLDALKGYGAVLLAGQLVSVSVTRWPPIAQFPWQGNHMARFENAAALAAVCAVLGHIFPIWLRFKGGKGVATAFGVLIALVPAAALLSLLVFVITVLFSRYVSLASILGSIAVPIAAFALPHYERSPWLVAVLIVIPAIVVIKHRGNIRRLMGGTEYRFGRTAKTA